MKKIFYLAFFMAFAISLKAQNFPIYLNYNSWPGTGQNTNLQFNQQTEQAIITIYNISGADVNTFLNGGSVGGTLSGATINGSLQGKSYVTQDDNSISIRLDQLLKNMTTNDRISIILIKGTVKISYSIGYDASSATLPQLTAAQIKNYQDNFLKPHFIKRDVGFKYRYLKPDAKNEESTGSDKKNDVHASSGQQQQDSINVDTQKLAKPASPDSGQSPKHKESKEHIGSSKATGKKIISLTQDQLSDENNHLLDNYTIHIFLDQYGNNLFASTPTGIQQKYHYMLHIIVPSSVADKLHYSISVTSGSLTDVGTSYNSQLAPPTTAEFAASNKKRDGEVDDIDQGYSDFTYNIFPTTDDLTYSIALKADGYDAANFTKTYTIKKTSFYRGSFDVGVFKTWLNNPTFTLVNAPTQPGTSSSPPVLTAQTVKITSNGPNVTATFMYTFYYSIINAIFPTDENNFRHSAWGRTFLDDDGSFIRKIYPAIGVGLSGNVLDNWFVGLNCQPMQGFGIFAGANIRKVNTFDTPVGFDINSITQDQFNYYSNTKTKSEWAVGIILDTSIFTKIASSISSSAK